MIHSPGVTPARLRNKLTLKAGRPGAPASSALEGAALTDHRVSEALA